MMGGAEPERRAMRRVIITVAAMLMSLGAVAQGLPTAKPDPMPGPSVTAPQAPPAQPPATRARCAQPLMDGCMRMQSSCQMACPGMWSTNPSAPAFTPTDRAGCLSRCGSQYRMCLIQYGCL